MKELEKNTKEFEFAVLSNESVFVPSEVPIIPFNYEEIKDLVDDYVVNLKFDDIERFEAGIVGVNIFGSKYLYYHKDLKIFLTFASDRFRVFRVSDILHVLRPLFDGEAKGYVNQHFVKFVNDKITYLNSYSKITKEMLRYNPLLLNIFTLKHMKGNITKRAIVDVVAKLDKLVEEGMIDFEKKVDKEDLQMFIDEMGVRAIHKVLGVANSERDIDVDLLMETRLITNVREFIDAVNKIHNAYPTNLAIERGITNLSKNVILKFLDNKILENIF